MNTQAPSWNHSSACQELAFDEALREYLRHAPWYLVSGGVHAVIFLVLAQFPWSIGLDSPDEVRIVAEYTETEFDPIEPTPPEVPEEKSIEETEAPLDDPIVHEEVLQADDELGDTDDEFGPTSFETERGVFEGTGMNDVLGVGGGAGGRAGGKYGRRGAARGGGRATQRAVDLGLGWLARHQDPRGFWSSASFDNMCSTNLCDGAGDPCFDVGLTGLSLLAFLGANSTVDHGPYRDNVRRGLRYLVSGQDPETGCFGEVGSHQQFMYDHALATLALCEGYGLSGWPILKEPAQRGISFIHSARNPYKAWRYAYPPDGTNDLSVTGWMVMAMKSAEDFGLRVDAAALDGARLFIDEVTDPSTWRAGYMERGSFSAREAGLNERWPEDRTEALTAVAMLCRIFLGEDPSHSKELRGGADLLLKRLPRWGEQDGEIDYYYWYYGSYAMWQMGGRDWQAWQEHMLDAVVKTQRRDGCERGSWDPQFDPWGHRGGRVYSTGLMTLCLEVYYRYDRLVGGR